MVHLPSAGCAGRRAAAIGMGLVLAACGRVSLGSQELDAARAGASGTGGAGSGAGTSPGGTASLGAIRTDTVLEEGIVPSGPPDAGGPDAEVGFGVEPPSCERTRPLCGDDDSAASCCESLAVPAGSVALDVGNGVTIQASVSSFRLDRFEVSVGRMREFIAAYEPWRARQQPAPELGAHPLIEGSGWQERFTASLPASAAAFETGLRECVGIPFSTYADGLTENVPLNCATWFEAAAFCAWDGGRLPTFAELAYAGAGGEQNRVYPWGDTPVPRRELALFGCRIDVDYPICTLDDVSPVGLRPLGAGRFGQDDLAGSMSEWVLDGAPAFSDPCVDCASLDDDSVRMWRGGGWLDGADQMRSTHFAGAAPTLRNLFLGFRCARD
jgi:formylglycine-generating enzyme required for sulfatase activity